MKDKDFTTGFTWSLLVHAALLSLFAINWNKELKLKSAAAQAQAEQQAEQATGPKDKYMEVTIIDPPKKDTGEVAEASDDGFSATPHAKDDCVNFFGGIGISRSVDSLPSDPSRIVQWIAEVYKGYPAERAGLQVGDQIVSNEEIRGEIGTKVVVRISRHGQEIDYEIVRDKICTTAPNQRNTP